MREQLERRAVTHLEIRADNGSKEQIRGYFSVFGTLSVPISGWYKEEMQPGAFTKSLRGDYRGNIALLYSHDMAEIFGTTQAKTFSLSEDLNGRYGDTRGGLYGVNDPPDTTRANDTIKLMKRGDITGASIGYFTKTVKWRQQDDWDIREVHDLDLVEATVTGFPAVAATNIGVRSYLSAGIVDEHLALIERALNRIENKLDLVEKDKDVLREYRSQLSNELPPAKRDLLEAALGPKTDVVSPAALLEIMDAWSISA